MIRIKMIGEEVERNVRHMVSLPAGMISAVYRTSRGTYQAHLLQGRESWSGSSLKGEASLWGARYAESRANLLARVAEAVAPWGWRADTEIVFDENAWRWRRKLVLWSPSGKSAHVW